VLPFAHLEVIVGLTRDGGQSMSSCFLRHQVIEWLGDISAAVYLVHHPLIMYIAWASNGFKMLKWPPQVVCGWLEESVEVKMACWREQLDFELARKIPLIATPAVVLYSILAGVVITYCFEKPLQHCLRGRLGGGGGGSSSTTSRDKTLLVELRPIPHVKEIESLGAEEMKGLLSDSA